jgi:hypothetical protein
MCPPTVAVTAAVVVEDKVASPPYHRAPGVG